MRAVHVVGAFAFSVLAVAGANARAQPQVYVEPPSGYVPTEPYVAPPYPAQQPPPQVQYAPPPQPFVQPPVEYGQPPAQQQGYGQPPPQTPPGTVWVAVPDGYRMTLAPEDPRAIQAQPQAYRADVDYGLLDRRIDSSLRRARRNLVLQGISMGLLMAGAIGFAQCDYDYGASCGTFATLLSAGAIGFHVTGALSAISVNRAARLLDRQGIHVGRGTGRAAVAFSFLPFGSPGALVFTTLTLGRIRRARAQQRIQPTPQPMQQGVVYVDPNAQPPTYAPVR
jgi:hypothetical protein